MSDARYVELAFPLPAGADETLAAEWIEALIGLGAPGVEERDGSTFDKSAAPELVVYIAVAAVGGFLERARAAGLPPPGEGRRVHDEDEWRDAWKAFFKPRRVGHFVIVPSWEPYTPAADERVLDLDPGRAFGTGGHASTRLCLELLAELGAYRRFLDVGCGSGVLAIAAAKQRPEASGVALDVDPESVEVAGENAAHNGVAERLTLATTPVEALDEAFDLVLANILPDVLVPLAPTLARRLRPGGRLILSGILVELADAVAAAYRDAGLTFLASRDEAGWRALVFGR